MSEFKGTKGPCTVGHHLAESDEMFNVYRVYDCDDNTVCEVFGIPMHRTLAEVEKMALAHEGVRYGLANARLIAEAFTVRHETNMTPRALAERVAQLESQVEDMLAGFVEINALHPMEINQFNYDADDVAAINENASNASVIAYNMVKKFKPETAEVKAE